MNFQNEIQGIPLTQLADQFGTPCYVYDSNKIRAQVSKLRECFAGTDLKIKFAAKALTNLSILRFMKHLGVGVDVVSPEEGKLAQQAGFTPGEIMFTPSGVDAAEIEFGAEAGYQINLDNLSALEWIGARYGSTKSVSIRLNPSILAGGNYKISTGHKHSKFGIPVEQMAEILTLVKKYDLQVNGLHIHTGSEIKEASIFRQMGEILFDLCKHFPKLQFLDFGSGFKVAYHPDDVVPDLTEIGSTLSNQFQKFQRESGKTLQLWIEPGKFLVSEAGILLTKVNAVKANPERTFACVNTGLNHLIRPMMYDAYHHILNVSNPEGQPTAYQVTGYICETDTFATDRVLPEIRQGDLLAILNAGAYGYMMASNYNSRLRPPEVLVHNGKAHLVRKREHFEDLIRNQPDEIRFDEL